MRIGIYNPYFDGFGGGERYTLTLASHWSIKHNVFLFWDDDGIRKIAEQRFNIDLSRVKTTQNFFRSKNILKKALLSKKYDLIFFLSDGSIPTSFARYNFLHFQVPFSNIHVNPIKLRQYQAIICNSFFTKDHLDSRLRKKSVVIYPPVDTSKFHASQKKEKIIFSAGRFTSYFESKKQDALIESWKKLKDKKTFQGWELILVGGLLPSDQEYFQSLQQKAQGLSIRLLPNIPFDALVTLYAKASIYWHAAGFGQTDPRLMEHFGITTVEAMASGCIPIVYSGGGLPEIVTDKVNGFLWKTTEELISKTEEVITHQVATEKMRQDVLKKAHDFDVARFCASFDELLDRTIRI